MMWCVGGCGWVWECDVCVMCGWVWECVMCDVVCGWVWVGMGV